MEVHGRRAESDDENDCTGTDKFCQHCEYENVTTKAKGICLECEEYMCNPCFRNHLKTRMCRHHELTDLDKASLSPEKSKQNEEKCKEHDNEAVRFYCRTHDIVGCGDCIILEHSACKSEYIKNLSKDFQETEEFKGLMRKLEQLQATNKANDKKCQDNRKDCKVMHEDALKEIRKFRADINKYLDKVEANIISETEQLKRDNDTLLDKLQQEFEKYSSKFDTLKQKLNTDIHRGNVLFIHAVNCKPVVKKIEQEVAKVLSENKIKQFKFVPDEQLVKIVTSERMFGNLPISESKLPAKEDFAISAREEEPSFASHDKDKKEVAAGAHTIERETVTSARIFGSGNIVDIGLSSKDKVAMPKEKEVRLDFQDYGKAKEVAAGEHTIERETETSARIFGSGNIVDIGLSTKDKVAMPKEKEVRLDFQDYGKAKEVAAGAHTIERETVTSARKFGSGNIVVIGLTAEDKVAIPKENEVRLEFQDYGKAKEVRPSGVCVGARVRFKGWSLMSGGQTGTVTAVRSGGRVDMEWDATGHTCYGYTIGPGGRVELI